MSVRVTSLYRSLPHFAAQNAQMLCKSATRHPCRASEAEREVPRATCNERGARSSPRRICRASPIIGTLHKASCDRVLLRNHGSLSYLVILSERIKHESLRTDKRKTAWSFFKSRLIRANPHFLLQKKSPYCTEAAFTLFSRLYPRTYSERIFQPFLSCLNRVCTK